MNYRSCLILFVILLLISCNKDEISEDQSKAFIKFYGGRDLVVEGVDVGQTADGGYVVLAKATYENETTDIYLVGTDKYGNRVDWSPKLIGYEFNEEGNRILVLNDGFLIIGTIDQSGAGETDMYIVKTDLEGSVQWDKMIGSTGNEEGYDICVAANGDFIIAGVTDDPAITWGNKSAYMLVTSNDLSVIKKRGTISYQYFEAGARAIREISGGYIMLGTITDLTTSYTDILIARSNESFTEILAKNVGRATNDVGEDIYVTTGGEIYILGSSNNPQTNFSEIYFGQVEPDLLEMTWSDIYYETNYGLEAGGFTFSDEGYFAITGSRRSVADQDMLFLKIDSGGNEMNRKFFGKSGFQEGTAISYTPGDQGYIITGTNGFEVFSMVTLVKTGPDGTLE